MKHWRISLKGSMMQKKEISESNTQLPWENHNLFSEMRNSKIS
jgi:hypothetical protein